MNYIFNYKINNQIKYNYEPKYYINNYIGLKSHILQDDFQNFFNDLDIQFIKINDFIKNMFELFQIFINNDNKVDEYILIQTDKNKSQMWLNMLFLYYLTLTDNFIKFKDRLHFISITKYNKKSFGKILPIKTSYNLLYIDDGIYSGTQSSSNISNFKKIQNINKIYVIAYITYEGKKLLQNNNNIIFYNKNILMFKDNKNYEKIHKWLNNNLFNLQFKIRKNHSLTIFEHKMADDASIPINFINNTEISIYYRYNTNEEYGKLYYNIDFSINKNNFNNLIFPCAKPRILSEGSSDNICYPRYYTLNKYCIKNNELYMFIEQNNNIRGGYYYKYKKYKNKYLILKKINFI